MCPSEALLILRQIVHASFSALFAPIFVVFVWPPLVVCDNIDSVHGLGETPVHGVEVTRPRGGVPRVLVAFHPG